MCSHLPLVRDAALRHSLGFGVGLHHAGLEESDRALVERLFLALKIQARSKNQRGRGGSPSRDAFLEATWSRHNN